MTDKPKV